ncbi:MAG: hypothetical protein U5J97_10275 [Trueperaceae bacterium]|nr:hypothetical protein [Trueperaceae bacterium]
MDAGSDYPLNLGSVEILRDTVNVTGNYTLTFGTFTIVPKPVVFDIANSDFVIDDGAASAHVFQSDGSSEIRGLEVDSDPAGVNSFVFSYRRTHDENHDPVPSGQQTVQNINLLGSYVVTVTATDPNYDGSDADRRVGDRCEPTGVHRRQRRRSDPRLRRAAHDRTPQRLRRRSLRGHRRPPGRARSDRHRQRDLP